METHILISSALWLFNIAMENGPFIDGLPIKNGDCPWLCLNNQMVISSNYLILLTIHWL